ncbi:MAG: AI-2E family transporter, partial [Oscillospiraceae bacterium]|nr:AI-2E family transporter [Oscillospiraceae bacterium]
MKSRKIWKTVLIALGCALGAWAFGALLLPVLLPFFIGLAVSLLAEKPVRLLQTRAHVPRSLASGLCVLLLFGLLFGGLFFLCRLLCAEAADLARQLPRLAENLAPLFEKLKSRLLALAERLPDGLGTGLRAGVEEFFKTGAGFGTKLYETLFSWASGIIGRLPDAVLFAVTAILSSFMLSGELPAIRGWLRRTVRPAWLEKLQTLGGHVRTTLGGWLRAQLK